MVQTVIKSKDSVVRNLNKKNNRMLVLEFHVVMFIAKVKGLAAEFLGTWHRPKTAVMK